MNIHERKRELRERMQLARPAHELPHFNDNDPGVVFITATNYEHKPILGYSLQRLQGFTSELLEVCQAEVLELDAYCVLKNHYHLLGYTKEPKLLRKELGRLHGRTSREWNLEENLVGRKVWFRLFDEFIWTNRKFYSILNYIHHNPVKKAYCSEIEQWPFSSAAQFIERVGRQEAERLQREYPFEKQ